MCLLTYLSSWSCQLYGQRPLQTLHLVDLGEGNNVFQNTSSILFNYGKAVLPRQDLAENKGHHCETNKQILWTYHFSVIVFYVLKNPEGVHMYTGPYQKTNTFQGNQEETKCIYKWWREIREGISISVRVGSASFWLVDFIGKISREHLSIESSNVKAPISTMLKTLDLLLIRNGKYISKYIYIYMDTFKIYRYYKTFFELGSGQYRLQSRYCRGHQQ